MSNTSDELDAGMSITSDEMDAGMIKLQMKSMRIQN